MRYLHTMLIVLFVTLAVTLAHSQSTPERFAILISNENYDLKTFNLKHPHNNTGRLAKKLEEVGFEVHLVKDASYQTLKEALNNYTEKLRKAGNNALGFFYYSGQANVDKKSKSPFIISKDTGQVTGEKSWNNTFAVNELNRSLKRMAVNASHIAVFDTCYLKKTTDEVADMSGLATIPRMLISYISINCNVYNKDTEKSTLHVKFLSEEIEKKANDLETLFQAVQKKIDQQQLALSWLKSNAFPKLYLSGEEEGKKTKTYLLRVAPDTPKQEEKTVQAITKKQTQTNAENSKKSLEGEQKNKDEKQLTTAEPKKEKTEKNPEPEKVAEQEEQKKATEPETTSSIKAQTIKAAIKIPKKAKKKMPHGHTFDDCGGEVWCPSMIVVKGGTFTMGSPEKEKGRQSDEGPQRKVTVKSLAVGKYEITFGEWDVCVKEGVCKNKPDDEGWGRDKQPVINVSWEDIQSYVSWLSKKTGEKYRLLTEAEWEYIARAGSITPYSFGDKIADLCQYANGADQSSGYRWRNKQCSDGVGKKTAPVGSFKPNAFNIYDVHGNVWEWVEDCWWKSYKVASSDGSAWLSKTPSVCKRRIVRGSSWAESPKSLRSANRSSNLKTHRANNYGFRVAREL